MSSFELGQRWVADSEPELGLGIVVEVAARTVTLFFELGECDRQYATAEAPLTRIIYSPGDEIPLADDSVALVIATEHIDGLVFYDIGQEEPIIETKISSKIALNQPFTRLITGQIDKLSWFYLRRRLDDAITRCYQSRLSGLLGVRANLVPHQLYIANAACNREKVRVLLADEVGLGKTIEAGMILSRLLKFERIERAVIVVPDALQVQWLIELVRKFNIMASLFDPIEYDFSHNQVHIVPHSALDEELGNILNAEFDLAIIDEAHNFSEDSDGFTSLSVLSEELEHLVLLTATPEQLGLESHFARLQLLDRAKFSQLEEFIEQEANYAELNKKIQKLPGIRETLIKQLELRPSDNDSDIIDQILDCHGIGRVMFRNVRSSINGFPNRLVHPYELEDSSWQAKYEWLATFANTHKGEKILVICHSIETVLECEQYLWNKHGIDTALFHEELNFIDRDKAAAYFSASDHGAQILVCSEIGSEGRNFQFCCHLVCLDLPSHPDILEQRIGRLDRIGQQRDVQIHIPFAAQSDTANQFEWYHRILNCIEQQNPAASKIHEHYAETFFTGMSEQDILAVKDQLASLEEQIQQGRDALLEMNSCRQPEASLLAQKIAEFEQATPLELVSLACELLNIHFEETRHDCYNLIPSDKMLLQSIPGIPEQGAEITFSREIACQREDLLFMTWDSPFIAGLWEILHHSEIGCASIAMLNSHQLPEGHCLLETCYDFIVQDKAASECLPFFPSRSIRTVCLDISDKDLSSQLTEGAVQQSLSSINKKLARNIINAKKEEIPLWYKKAESFALAKQDTLIQQTIDNIDTFFTNEIDRLDYLSQRNPSVDKAEVEQLRVKKEALNQAVKNESILQLSAIRLIVISKP